MSNKMWDVLVEHSKTCVLGGRFYIYYPDEPRNVGIIFNDIYELSGLISGGQYHSVDSLSDSQKVSSESMLPYSSGKEKISAYKKKKKKMWYHIFLAYDTS